ncbi:hypothetical protein HYU22_04005 [Candidatus Woesearchaeota archaeon]|nr:hypothetical protein [Candidatus Woesearchaeota archaeon]
MAKKTTLKDLVTLLSMPSFDGHVITLAGSGLLVLPMAPVFALTLLAGPGAILTAATLEGSLRERMITSIVAGIIATIILVLAAVVGTKLGVFVNFSILKLAGATAVLSIALLLFGAAIPQKTPLTVMALGIIASIIWR